jgi:hypothetical protein
LSFSLKVVLFKVNVYLIYCFSLFFKLYYLKKKNFAIDKSFCTIILRKLMKFSLTFPFSFWLFFTKYNMAPSLLFGINNEGRAYALSTANSAWREFLYLGLEFKKLSSVPHFIWAIGSDRQVYVHVHSLDVPIRICEVSYENERWYPGKGWSQILLPTDRPRFSSEDGLLNREIEKIRLPSMAWQWESKYLCVIALQMLM